MKKFFAIAALAVASLTVNAQTWIGGSFGFNWDKSKDEGAKATTSWEIAPEVGHDIDETWAIAIKLGVNSSKHGDDDELHLALAGAVGFLDGGLAYKSHGSHKGNSFGIGIKPGVAYKVAEGISLEAKFGGFGWTTFSKDGGNKDKFGLGVDTEDLSFGIFFDI